MPSNEGAAVPSGEEVFGKVKRQISLQPQPPGGETAGAPQVGEPA